MKKFYSLALAALFAASSVSAAGLNFRQLSLGDSKFVSNAQSIALPHADKAINNVELKDDIDPTDLSGSYIWSFTSLTQSTAGQTVSQVITITKTSNTIYTIDWLGYQFTATYSMIKQTLTIPSNQNIGFNEANNIDLFFYNLDISTGQPKALTTAATATLDGDKLVFDASTVLGIGNVDAGGYFFIGEDNVWTLSNAVVWDNIFMPADGWVSCGTGEFADAWQVIGYGGQQVMEANTWEVAIEENQNEPGLYRIVNPYTGNCPIAQFNTDPTGEGYILFSIADPDFVMVYPYTYSGLRDDMGAYLNWNPEGAYILDSEEFSKEYIIEEFKITPSTFDAANAKVTFRNCAFGTTEKPTNLSRWQDQQGNLLVGEGWLKFNDKTFGGINDVANDAIDANAPVEFYNLQGIRILNVENNAGLYIRKQGNKTTKVYVK